LFFFFGFFSFLVLLEDAGLILRFAMHTPCFAAQRLSIMYMMRLVCW
jgi:hypothetical protein